MSVVSASRTKSSSPIFDCFAGSAATGAWRKKSTSPAAPHATDELVHLCVFLHSMVQRLAVKMDLQTTSEFQTCTKVLRQLNVPIEILPNFAAASADAATYDPGDRVILSSPRYRLLKNRAIAALATIADLSARSIPKGDPAYRAGLVAGYAHASEIAAAFLEDIHAESAIK
jgi:hypothetical protein